MPRKTKEEEELLQDSDNEIESNDKKDQNDVKWYIIVIPFIITLVGLLSILEEVIPGSSYQKGADIEVSMLDAVKASMGMDISKDKDTNSNNADKE